MIYESMNLEKVVYHWSHRVNGPKWTSTQLLPIIEILRPVLFVVQVMSDISKQDGIHNKQTPYWIKSNSYNEQKSPAYSYNS